jgi:anti-sigma B factor antagonist
VLSRAVMAIAGMDETMMIEHDPLIVAVEISPDATFVRCRGRLTTTASSRLQHEVKPLIRRSARIIIDLTDVSFMDSMGLGTIASLYVSARTTGCRFQLINLSPRVRELFSVTHLLSLFEACGETNIPIP